MRKVVVTKEYEVYKYNELTDGAKENVKRWYLDGQSAEIFTEDCEYDLEVLFGKNDLEVQYSLGYCQGDGFNIYGKISAEQIFNCLKVIDVPNLLNFKDMLTEEEKAIILEYAKECGEIELPYNNHYCYSLADYIDIVDEWTWYLEEEECDKELLEKFEQMVRNIFESLCNLYEENGYKYFYEISEEDLEECCEANEYEFLADGTLF